MQHETVASPTGGIGGLAKSFVSLWSRASDLGGVLGGVFLFCLVLLTLYEVVMRYIFNSPTTWSLDLSIYFLVWMTFVAMAKTQKGKHNVHVDLLVSRISGRKHAILSLLTSTLFLAATGLMLYYSVELVRDAITRGETSIGLWVHPIWPVKLALPVGTLLLFVWLAVEWVQKASAALDAARYPGHETIARSLGPALVAISAIAFDVFLLSVNSIAGVITTALTLLFIGLPVFPALLLTGVGGLVFGLNARLAMLSFPDIMYGSLNDFTLVVLPLFMVAGVAVQMSGVGYELYDACSKWLRWLPGGEGIATVVACSIFAAISASSVATAATIGMIAIPELLKRGYRPRLVYGLLAAGGTLGIMIPPSGPMIIYSSVTEESLGKLFLAGVIPGLILAGGFALVVATTSFLSKNVAPAEPVSWGERFRASRTAMWGLSIPVIIMGGILSGIFTPLESGAIAAGYALAMVFARGKLKLTDMPRLLSESVTMSTMIFSIIVGALVFGYFMTAKQVPMQLANWVTGSGMDPWGVIAVIMVLMLVLGMFLEVISILLIVMPIFYPLIIALGFDGIWFAVVVVVNMELALITPPVGLNCFVIQGIAKTNLGEVIRGIVPFFFVMLAGLLLFAAVPELSTWLPDIAIPTR